MSNFLPLIVGGARVFGVAYIFWRKTFFWGPHRPQNALKNLTGDMFGDSALLSANSIKNFDVQIHPGFENICPKNQTYFKGFGESIGFW